MLINLRNALITGKRLPYDAEVEYLESTGTQYVDTGYAVDCTTDVIDCRVAVTSVKNYGTAFGVYEYIDSGGRFFGVRRNGTRDSWQSLWGTPSHSLYLDTFYNIHYEYGADKCRINETTGTSSANVAYTKPIYIYAINGGNGVAQFNAQRLYSFNVKRNGALVRDYIPVRKGTVGAMYDRRGVGGMNPDGTARNDGMYYNRGTGDFVLGPDVVPVEYIESHGTEYISLTDRMLPTDSCDAMVGVTTTTTNQGFLFGARKQEGTGWLYSGFRRLASSLTSNAQWAKSSGSYNRTLGDFSSSLQPFHWEFNYVSFGGVRDETTLANAIDLGLNWALFAVASSTGTYGNINGGRIGSFSITRSGAKIIDFRPVRVGSGSTWEGAMMDTLTRRVYRNAGTGAFTYGNDLKYPIPAE